MSDDVTSSVTVKSNPTRFDGFRFRSLSTALRYNIIRSTTRTSMQQYNALDDDSFTAIPES